MVFVLLRPADGMAFRLGLTVGRKCGGAVARNRIKRVLRELFRLYWSEFELPLDIVIVARKTLDVAGLSLESARRELAFLGPRLRKDFSSATEA